MPDQLPPVALSTASVYPESAEVGFLLAAELGYDGVELMVWTDPLSQDIKAVERLSARYRVPVLAVHAPCLAVTQRVWGTDPLERLRRSGEAAGILGAGTVVIHPPFRWQRGYAAAFADTVEDVARTYEVAPAVENMFPVRRAGLSAVPYAPSADPTDVGHRYYTLDLSHTAVAGVDALAMMDRMGDGLAHVHLADGSGSARDEHLVPGRGNQPCAEVCERLVASGFDGVVVLEVSTRRARTRHDRAALLAESLLFTRLSLQPPAPVVPTQAEPLDPPVPAVTPGTEPAR
ncbi:sugar phosphate isomerase/epimerase family protein [Pseudonocardia acaciae]|uniref:sugar phosphate isomerase/epimerase family protein n=1 Tax=Pseudonocardia acaciae TaxID=551276 RepID=UPI0006890112|nr:sugar phosphate isomerase/epimerase [Pseudonocardia acaciae]